MKNILFQLPVSRRDLLRSAGVIAVGSAVPSLLGVRADAHGDVRDLHVYMGDGYYRSEDYLQGIKSAETNQNEIIRAEIGELVTLSLHNEGKFKHSAYFGRKANVEERRFEESLFAPFHSITLEPGGFVVFQVTIPSQPGEWEIGDFSLEQDGHTHYEEGMKLKLIVQS